MVNWSMALRESPTSPLNGRHKEKGENTLRSTIIGRIVDECLPKALISWPIFVGVCIVALCLFFLWIFVLWDFYKRNSTHTQWKHFKKNEYNVHFLRIEVQFHFNPIWINYWSEYKGNQKGYKRENLIPPDSKVVIKWSWTVRTGRLREGTYNFLGSNRKDITRAALIGHQFFTRQYVNYGRSNTTFLSL